MDVNKTLVSWVVVLFVLLVMIAFFNREFVLFKDNETKNKCKTALYAQAMSKIGGDDSLSIFFGNSAKDVPCPVIYKEISGGKEEIEHELADALYDSWDMVHQGSLEFFEGKTGEETYCILTHHIKFDKDMMIDDFVEYLMDHERNGVRYIDFLKPYSTYSPDEPPDPNFKDIVIDTSRDYGIMFVYAKEGYLHRIWKSWKWLRYGALGGGALVLYIVPEPVFSKAGATALAGGIMVGGVSGATAGYTTGSSKSADWEAAPFLFPYDSEFLSALNCTYMVGDQRTR